MKCLTFSEDGSPLLPRGSSVVATPAAATRPTAHPRIARFGGEISFKAAARRVLARFGETMAGAVATAAFVAVAFAVTAASAGSPTAIWTSAAFAPVEATTALEATLSRTFTTTATASPASLAHPAFVVDTVVGKETGAVEFCALVAVVGEVLLHVGDDSSEVVVEVLLLFR